ncbi:MAG: right-handed parallel beta-helix repeat-containing protein, partial [Candidatus Heimdallarchaeota archaeon]
MVRSEMFRKFYFIGAFPLRMVIKLSKKKCCSFFFFSILLIFHVSLFNSRSCQTASSSIWIDSIFTDISLKPKSMNSNELSQISIDGDSAFGVKASEEGWSGDGSHENPYVISDLVFDDITKPPYPYSGIKISNCQVYFQITNCTFIGSEDGQIGIYLHNVSNGDISNNIITNMSCLTIYPEGIGIYLQNSHDISIQANNISNNELAGIYITDSNTITIIQNTLTNNGLWTGEGIKLVQSPNNRINGNIFINNTLGISGDTVESYRQLEVVNNSLNDKSLIYWVDKSGGTVPIDAGQVLLINCDSVILENQNFSDVPISVLIAFCDNLLIRNNTFENCKSRGLSLVNSWANSLFNNSFSTCYFSIVLSNSTKNNISANNFSVSEISISVAADSDMNLIFRNSIHSSTTAISIDSSTQNTIKANILTSEYGVHLYHSTNNSILDNIFFKGGINIEGSQYEHFIQSEVSNNTVNGKPIVYWKDKSGDIVPTNAGQVILANCNDITIIDQDLSNSSKGILIAFSTNILITKNSISNKNWIGIYIYNSHYCNISNNFIVTNNHYGLHILGSDNLVIFGNNISNNVLVGMIIEHSNDTIISNNFISYNHNKGIYLYNVRSGTIFNNSFFNNNGAGVYLENSRDYIISWNTFFENNLFPIWRPFWDTQVVEETSSEEKANTFVYNYWSDWTSPDIDNDGIVDESYSFYLDNQDPYPLVIPVYEKFPPHLLLNPRIVFPNGGETLNGSITIFWIAAIDS